VVAAPVVAPILVAAASSIAASAAAATVSVAATAATVTAAVETGIITAEVYGQPVTQFVSNLIPGGGGSGMDAISSSTAVSTNSVFYSGGDPALNAATNFANSTGGTTLNMTPIGQCITGMQNAGLDWNTQILPLVQSASADFAHTAVGEVNVFIYTPWYNPDGIWETIEEPILLNNPNVTGINYHSLP
jgi:hypothetical protein